VTALHCFLLLFAQCALVPLTGCATARHRATETTFHSFAFYFDCCFPWECTANCALSISHLSRFRLPPGVRLRLCSPSASPDWQPLCRCLVIPASSHTALRAVVCVRTIICIARRFTPPHLTLAPSRELVLSLQVPHVDVSVCLQRLSLRHWGMWLCKRALTLLLTNQRHGNPGEALCACVSAARLCSVSGGCGRVCLLWRDICFGGTSVPAFSHHS